MLKNFGKRMLAQLFVNMFAVMPYTVSAKVTVIYDKKFLSHISIYSEVIKYLQAVLQSYNSDVKGEIV